MILWCALVRMLLTIYYVGEIIKYQGSFLTLTVCSYFLILEDYGKIGIISKRKLSLAHPRALSQRNFKDNRFLNF